MQQNWQCYQFKMQKAMHTALLRHPIHDLRSTIYPFTGHLVHNMHYCFQNDCKQNHISTEQDASYFITNLLLFRCKKRDYFQLNKS